ncbi:MAG TPA: SRPBCC family protein [Longimicrobiaceae bacterium]|nr:SRPBCC family protein [Longimicrobiaceae bacterium]
MATGNRLLTGVALGAGLMYLLDPDKGTRRRSLLRDQLVHLGHTAGDAAGVAVRDLGNRTRGVAAETRGRVLDGSPDDTVLEARVRSALGRLVSHPGAVHVVARDGQVTLTGPVLADEVETLLAGVRGVRGVKGVENRLQVHEEAGDVSSLQGEGRKRRGPGLDVMQENWAPATRLLVGALGAGMALGGMRRNGPLAALAAVAGLGLLSRAATNLDTARLIGADGVRRAVDVHKTITVDAPVEEVFALWSNYENFPRFMTHLREVRTTGEGCSRWVAELPGGVPVRWEAETTQLVPNELIAWRSVEGSPVHTEGMVCFQPCPDGGTRVDVRMSYNPPAGAIGHAVVWLFGTDAKRMIDDDLVRFQSLLEIGKTRAHGHLVTREEVVGTV